MKMKLSEAKQVLRKLLESYVVGKDGEFDLANPKVIQMNKFGMKDQTASTRLANQSINLNEPDDSDDAQKEILGIDLRKALQKLGVKEAKGKKPKKSEIEKDSYGNDFPWSILHYARQASESRKK